MLNIEIKLNDAWVYFSQVNTYDLSIQTKIKLGVWGKTLEGLDQEDIDAVGNIAPCFEGLPEDVSEVTRLMFEHCNGFGEQARWFNLEQIKDICKWVDQTNFRDNTVLPFYFGTSPEYLEAGPEELTDIRWIVWAV